MSTFAISSQASERTQLTVRPEKHAMERNSKPMPEKELVEILNDRLELQSQVDRVPKVEELPSQNIEMVENTKPQETLKNENSWKEIREMVHQVKNELRQQQLEQLLHLIEKTDSKAWESVSKEGHGNSSVIQIMVLALENEKAPLENTTVETENPINTEEEASTLNSYWNAENTANRIVGFAMRFAETHDEDPLEFAEIIKGAIEQGFGEALAITGELPGAAGKLNRETHELTFKKLQEKLDAWTSIPYNKPSPTPPQTTSLVG